jgi:AraC family transcriptional regulator, regulatory protein of adaptative response / methylated-DNA-[protein]-cysteine methyltransferase
LSEALHVTSSPEPKIDRVSSGDEWLSELVERVATHLPSGRYDADNPVRRGRYEFSAKSVWRALQQIPPGETRSYSEVARRKIRHPKAVRAVAQACAANRIAVVVPCHRVVREDGTLGGYRWGVDVKARLLEAESGREEVERYRLADPRAAEAHRRLFYAAPAQGRVSRIRGGSP